MNARLSLDFDALWTATEQRILVYQVQVSPICVVWFIPLPSPALRSDVIVLTFYCDNICHGVSVHRLFLEEQVARHLNSQ